MTVTPVQANVVLTADNSQYDMAMDQSTQSTNSLAKSVDGLGTKINNLSKSAGRKILGVTAADVALIGGATAAWASYQKQMTGLMAQSAVLSRTQVQQTNTMKDYTASVDNLRKNFGTTTEAAAALTQAVSKLTSNTRGIQGITTIFEKMSMATGESAAGLATSLLQLQKMMGTPTRDTQKYADQLTYLAAKSNTSATALSDFTAQLAPMGRAMGMSQKQVTGFANMFVKAGQDGYTAATAFVKVQQDITNAVQTGNPDLNKYANLLGVSVQHFKQMGGAEQLAGFLDRIASLGPKAAAELNRFGFDGVRMARAITGTVQASGGAMAALREANVGYRSDAVDKGAKAAENLSTTMAKIRQDIQKTAESFATILGPGVAFLARGLEKLTSVFSALMDGPFGKFAQVAAAVLVPLGAMAGAAALLAGTIVKLSGAFLLFRNAGAYGLKEGLQGGARIVAQTENGLRTGAYTAFGGARGVLGERGAVMAADARTNWWNRGTYNVGQQVGYGIRRGAGFLGGIGADEGVGTAGYLRRGTVGGIRLASDLYASQFAQMQYREVPDRNARLGFFGQHFPGRGPEVAKAAEDTMEARTRAVQAHGVLGAHLGTAQYGATPDPEKTKTLSKLAAEADDAAEAMAKTEAKVITLGDTAAKTSAMTVSATTKNVSITRAMAEASGTAAKAMAGAAAGAAKFTASVAASGAAQGISRGFGATAGALGMTPAGLGITAGIIAAPMIIGAITKYFSDDGPPDIYKAKALGGAAASYFEAGGQTDPATLIGTGSSTAAAPHIPVQATMSQALSVSSTDLALSKQIPLTASGKDLVGMSKEQALARLSTRFGELKDPKSVYALKLDLIKAGFAQGDAQWIMTNLSTGKKGGGMTAFLNAATFGSNAAAGKAISGALGYVSDKAAHAATVGGAGAMSRTQVMGQAQMYRFGMGGAFKEATSYTAPGTPFSEGSSIASSGNFGYSGGTTPVQIGAGKPASFSYDNMRQWAARLNYLQTLQERTGIKTTGEIATTGSANPQWAGAIKTAKEKWLKSGRSLADFNAFSAYISDVTLTTADNASVKTLLGSLGADDSKRGVEAYSAAMDKEISKAQLPGTTDATMQQRIRKMGPAGQIIEGSTAVQKALSHQLGNVDEVNKAMTDVTSKFNALGMTLTDRIAAATKIQGIIGDPTDNTYRLMTGIIQQASGEIGMQTPLMSRKEQMASALAKFHATTVVAPTTADMQEQAVGATHQLAGTIIDQVQATKQMLLMQHQFEVSQTRAAEDFATQQSYQLEDFNLGRERAEEEFNIARERATQDYYRNVHRANFDFNLSRRRAEEDYQHQISVMAEQQAQQMYNIYERVDVARTSSTSWVLANAGDQLARMRDQEKNLDKLRKMGMSDAAINQLKLTDPAQAQQLERMVGSITKKQITDFNRVAGSARISASKALMTDPSNAAFREMQRQHTQMMDRSMQDHNRSMGRNEDDFIRGLRNQKNDYNRLMENQLEDFDRMSDRQLTQYHLSMERAQEDMADVGREISGTIQSILRRGATHLTGFAQEQAATALQAFKDLKTSTNPVAIAMMTELADILGFTYQVPKGVSNNKAEPARHMGGPVEGNWAGGVIPGWNPGRDTHTVGVGGGEAVMRPEWTRAVGGEKAVEAMNHAAIHGMFAKGGVYWPVPGHDTGTYPGHDGVDINRGSGWDDYGDPIRAFRSGKIVYVGSGKGYGDAIFESTKAGTVVYGHTSAQFVHSGQQVTGGQLIGKVGSTGNSSAPHLHFGIPGGTYEQAMALLAGAIVGGTGVTSAAASGAPFLGLIKHRYPKPEAQSFAMQGVHPLFPGDISGVINAFARPAIRNAMKAFGDPSVVASGNIGSQPYENMSNQQIVRIGARRMGWADQWPSLYQLVMHESGFRNEAQNPGSTAYGMFQFLDGTWPTVGGHKTSDPWLQTKYGMKYIQDRYGNPINAWHHWQEYNSYGDGSIFTQPNMIQVGEKGPEAVIPLNERGANFMARSVGLGGTPVHGGGGMNIYKTQIDRSTNFTGPITVAANDPAELITKLQARQRVMALSRPSLTGSAA